VVRVAAEQLADTVELPVGETEGPVELFRGLRQRAIVPGKADTSDRLEPVPGAGDLGRVTLEQVTRSYYPLLLALALLWGASYLFIKVGVRDLQPPVMMAARMLIAAGLLIGFLAARAGTRSALAQVGGVWRQGVVFGVINGALPFTLIAWGEKHIDSGVAAIANASVPIFVAVLAIWFKPSERSSGLKLLGIFVGLAGVGVLAGVHPRGGWWAVAGTLAVVAASLSYAAGGLYGQHSVARVPGPVLAAAAMLYGGMLLVPFALVELPGHAPGWKAIGSVLGLAVGGTAIAQLILMRMLRLFGAARNSLVTYLLPVTALIYGATILNEPLRPSMLAGLGLILGGVALGSGVLRPARGAVAEPPQAAAEGTAPAP
jgi:drug/metabolite transporter (DMT)-like permease